MSELHNFIDADTILVSACMAAQYNYMVYDKDGNKVCPAKSKKAWCEANGNLDPANYEFRREESLIDNRGQPAIDLCKHTVVRSVKRIERRYPDYKSWICIEGSGNFRDDLYPAYKGNRDGAVLLRKELSNWVVDTFPRVIVAEGCETDDVVSRYMWQGHKNYLRYGVYTHMVSGCDKDLRTVAGKLYNYCKDEEYIISEFEADKWYCTQLLIGDNIDNVKGINAPLEKEFLRSRGVRPNSRGVGQKTAEALLAGCKTSKDLFEVVRDCYRNVHGDQWLFRLQEEALALRMCHTEAETQSGSHYKIVEHFDYLGVTYAE